MIVTQQPFFWDEKLNHHIENRIGAAPDELVQYIALVNAATGVPCIPTAEPVPADLIDDLRSAMRGVPTVVNSLLQDVLLGVYFARGLGSSAITDVVVDDSGNIIGSVVVVDLDVFLERPANEWATWKENTPFRQSGALSLEVKIAEPPDNTRANAIQFLLLHEYGHVLTAGKRFLPIWWLGPEAMKATADYAFLKLAWHINADKKIVPKADEDFDGRTSISYYANSGLDPAAMLTIYEGLQATSFATLYASTNAYDDFAESFATYVHTVLMNRPLRVRIYSDGVVQLERENFWSSAQSAPKRAFMEQVLPIE